MYEIFLYFLNSERHYRISHAYSQIFVVDELTHLSNNFKSRSTVGWLNSIHESNFGGWQNVYKGKKLADFNLSEKIKIPVDF